VCRAFVGAQLGPFGDGGSGAGEAVGVGAGLDDVAAEGQPVDDGGAEPGIGEGLGPAGKRVVGRDRDGGFLLAVGEHLEQQFRAALIELHIAQFIDAKQIDAAVAGDGLGELLVIGGLDELVDELRGHDISDPVAGHRGGGAEADEQVAFAGARVADEAADLPVGERRVRLEVRVRRLVCPTVGSRRTFREQVPDVLHRYQRRTVRLAARIAAVVTELAGRASVRVLTVLGIVISRQTAIRSLWRIPVPAAAVPAVLGVDDFALRKRRRYATILIDAVAGRRVDVLPDRTADTLEAWLRAHPGVSVVCRDGSGAYAEAVRRALPDAVQVADWWHLWHNLAGAVVQEVAGHSGCWAKATRPRDGTRNQSTAQRWTAVHDLLGQGVGLLECARRLNLALNTVKRYARISEPDRLLPAPQYRPTLVDPYREHLRQRRTADPAVAVMTLFREIQAQGYSGSLNLLYRYITQGRVEGDRPYLSPRALARLILTRPDNLTSKQQQLRDDLVASCPQMIDLADLVTGFAALLEPKPGNDIRLDDWIATTAAADLPHLHAFTRGLAQDRDAVNAALTLPYHNGTTEGVNTKTKRIMRQMHGRANFALLRHRILLS
jgi:transposase